MMKNIVLLTAPPRTGKSTLIKKVVAEIGEENFCGFFTEEMRENDERVAFKVKDINGDEFTLAHVDMKSGYKIDSLKARGGAYYVDIDKFETFIANLFAKIKEDKILCIDEIGPMQAFSPVFRKMITELFNSPTAVLGTIFYDENKNEWIDEIKKSDKIDLVNLSIENRDEIVPEIIEKINAIRRRKS